MISNSTFIIDLLFFMISNSTFIIDLLLLSRYKTWDIDSWVFCLLFVDLNLSSHHELRIKDD